MSTDPIEAASRDALVRHVTICEPLHVADRQVIEDLIRERDSLRRRLEAMIAMLRDIERLARECHLAADPTSWAHAAALDFVLAPLTPSEDPA